MAVCNWPRRPDGHSFHFGRCGAENRRLSFKLGETRRFRGQVASYAVIGVYSPAANASPSLNFWILPEPVSGQTSIQIQ